MKMSIIKKISESNVHEYSKKKKKRKLSQFLLKNLPTIAIFQFMLLQSTDSFYKLVITLNEIYF